MAANPRRRWGLSSSIGHFTGELKEMRLAFRRLHHLELEVVQGPFSGIHAVLVHARTLREALFAGIPC